jgi:putative glutamine amidotransferase
LNSKPLIGISVSARFSDENLPKLGALTLDYNYVAGVVAAGGLPILLSPKTDAAELIGLIDGWLIPGGDDIDPARYGREKHEKTSVIDPDRYAFEQALWEAAPAELPIFGICYGCQFMNVQRGGTLMQHLPEVVGNEDHAGGTLAEYSVEAGTRLHKIVGETAVQGRSYHHQSVARVGRDLVVSARHADGTIEALEATDRPWVVAAQWHPERTLDDATTQKLFRAFVQAAEAFGRVWE